MNKHFLTLGILIISVLCLSFSDLTQYSSGKDIYEKNCLSCHQVDGNGVPNMTPSLLNSAMLSDKEQLNKLVCAIEGGSIDFFEKQPNYEPLYNNLMPSFKFTDKEMLLLIRYLKKTFTKNKNINIQIQNIHNARQNCMP